MSGTLLHSALPVPATRDIGWSPSHGHHGVVGGAQIPCANLSPMGACAPHPRHPQGRMCPTTLGIPPQPHHPGDPHACSLPPTPEYPPLPVQPTTLGIHHLPVPSLSIPPPACAPPRTPPWAAVTQGRIWAPSTVQHRAFGADGSPEAAQRELGMVGQGPGKGLQGRGSAHEGTAGWKATACNRAQGGAAGRRPGSTTP